MVIAVLMAALVAVAGPARASAATPYVALGDSVGAGLGASPGHSYFDLYCSYLESPAGGSVANKCINESQVGATTQSALGGGMVDRAVSDIESSTDTPIVTIILGGNDLLGYPGCQPITGAACPFMANARTILDRLKTALGTHPGPHAIKWLEYYNPNHDNPFGMSGNDSSTASRLLGDDLAIGDCSSDTTTAIGLNDAIHCASQEKGATAVDAYAPFQSACATVACFSDSLHANDTGYALIFDAFRDAATTPQPALATIAALAESRRAFRPSHRHFKGGTVFSLRLDQPATITVALHRLAAGRLRHHRCLPQTPHVVKKPRCTRAIPLIRLSKQGHSGVNTLFFNGRVHGRALAPGHYLALVSATDPAGTSAAKRLRFTVLRPRSA
jgi:lysophospholipase L1-like esterase